MKNPYQVLGVTPPVTIDAVKAAYREKAAQCHSDAAKMDELNAAYDEIIANLNSSGSSSASGNGYAQQNGYSGSDFSDIRAQINSGRMDDAEMLLDGIPSQRRNAEWYYLKGTVQHRRGWLDSAEESFRTASSMEPNNPEYKAAYNQLHREKKGSFRSTYRESAERSGNSDGCCDPCNLCSGLICADCCCECMGGDLIRCC